VSAKEEEIFVYIYERGEVRYKELKNRFNEKTLNKYLRILLGEGKIKNREKDEVRRYRGYYIPPKHHAEAKALAVKLNYKIKLENILKPLSLDEQVELYEKQEKELERYQRRIQIERLKDHLRFYEQTLLRPYSNSKPEARSLRARIIAFHKKQLVSNSDSDEKKAEEELKRIIEDCKQLQDKIDQEVAKMEEANEAKRLRGEIQ